MGAYSRGIRRHAARLIVLFQSKNAARNWAAFCMGRVEDDGLILVAGIDPVKLAQQRRPDKFGGAQI